MNKGVFGKAGLERLVAAERIFPRENFSLAHINNASVDITIGGELYEVNCVVKPRNGKERVRDLLRLMGARPHSFTEPFRVGKSYLARSSIDVNFPPGLYGYASPKSTSGRLFLYVRVLTDRIPAFDHVDMRQQGLSGEIWLVIQPLCFDVLPSVVERYTQLRVFNADTRVSDEDLKDLLTYHDILYRRDTRQPYAQGDLSLFTHNGSIQMTLMARGEAPIGYVAKTYAELMRIGAPPIHLEARDLDWRMYFDPVYATQLLKGDEHSWGVWLKEHRHYLFATNELARIPLEYAFVLKELDGRHGNAVIHFAGFIDPGFGMPDSENPTKHGASITLEVCSPQNVFLRHKNAIATGIFEKMQEPAEQYVGNYGEQLAATPPKQFRRESVEEVL